MARPRAFDPHDKAERAMAAFWRLGYEGAGLTDLQDAMGLTRGSVYKAWGSKRALFLDALAHYQARHVAAMEAGLRGEGPGVERVAKALQVAVDAVRNGDRRGCMICAASGAAGDDPIIAGVLLPLLARMDAAFAAALADAGVDRPAQRGRKLTAVYVGLQTMARAGADPDVMQDVVEGAVASLG